MVYYFISMLFFLCIALLPFYLLLVVPALWLITLIHCIKQPPHDDKALWIIGMIVTGPLFSLGYGISASKKKWIQVYAWVVLALFVVIVAGIGSFYASFRNIYIDRVDRIIAENREINNDELSEYDQNEVQVVFQTIKSEIDAMSIGDWEQAVAHVKVAELYRTFAEDKVLTHKEYMAWLESFASGSLESESE